MIAFRPIRHLPLIALVLTIAVCRLLLWNNLEFDEAEQLYFVQALHPGYSAQPPLYTWVLFGLGKLIGINIASLTILETALYAAQIWLLYQLACYYLPRSWASVATLAGVLLVPVFAWDIHRRRTHTALLIVFSLLTLWSILRIHKRAGLANFVLLGLCLGGGALAKYNFVIFVAAVFIAAAFDPDLRSKIVTGKLLISLMIAALMCAPHLHWVVTHWSDVWPHAAERLALSTRWSRFPPVLVSIATCLAALFDTLLPMVTLAFILFRHCWKSPPDRLLERTILFGTAMVAAPILTLKTSNALWFGVLPLLLPIALGLRINADKLGVRQRRAAVVILVAAALAIISARFSFAAIMSRDGCFQTRDCLFQQEGQELRRARIQPREIVTKDIVVAGYQRLQLPDAPVVCLNYPPLALPPKTTGPVVAVWDATADLAPPRELIAWLRTRHGITQLGEVHQLMSTPALYRSSTRRIAYVVVEPQSR